MATSEADHSSTGSDEQVATLYACLHAKLPDLLNELCVCLSVNGFQYWDLSLLMSCFERRRFAARLLQLGTAECSAFDCSNTGISRRNSEVNLVANQKHVCSGSERIDHGLINC